MYINICIYICNIYNMCIYIYIYVYIYIYIYIYTHSITQPETKAEPPHAKEAPARAEDEVRGSAAIYTV